MKKLGILRQSKQGVDKKDALDGRCMTFVEQSNTHGITGLWRPRFRWQPPPTLALTKDQHILYWPDSINQSQHAFKQLLRPILYDPATFGGFRGTLLRIFSQRLANSMQVINLETVLVSKTISLFGWSGWLARAG